MASDDRDNYGNGFTSIEGGDRDDYPFQIPGRDQETGRPQSEDAFPVEPAPRFPDEKQSFRLRSAIVQIVQMIPERVLGMMQKLKTSGVPAPSIVSYKGREELIGENLVAVIHTLAASQVGGQNPFAGFAWTPGGGAFPADLYQSIVATAFMQMGTLGVNETIHFNVPVDQVIRLPFIAHTARVWGAIEPKYYPLLAAPGGADYDFTWISTTSNIDRNNKFNNPPPGTVAANGPPGGTWPPNVDVKVQGLIGRGLVIPSASNAQLSSRPLRRFFGWADKNLAQGKFLRCPVPRGAVSAMLVTDATGAAVLAAGLSGQLFNFRQVTSGPTGAAGEYYYNYAPNVVYQLRDGCDAIDVYPSGGAVPAARSVPFEIVFELGY